MEKIIIVQCSECGKIVNGKVPKGGDGSLWVPVRHKDNEKKPCLGFLYEGRIIKPTNP